VLLYFQCASFTWWVGKRWHVWVIWNISKSAAWRWGHLGIDLLFPTLLSVAAPHDDKYCTSSPCPTPYSGTKYIACSLAPLQPPIFSALQPTYNNQLHLLFIQPLPGSCGYPVSRLRRYSDQYRDKSKTTINDTLTHFVVLKSWRHITHLSKVFAWLVSIMCIVYIGLNKNFIISVGYTFDGSLSYHRTRYMAYSYGQWIRDPRTIRQTQEFPDPTTLRLFDQVLLCMDFD